MITQPSFDGKIIDFPTPKTKSNEWFTPSRYIEAAREVMGGIDLDPASCEVANRTVKAERYYTKEENGLTKPWYGRVWLNPPFGLVPFAKNGSTKSLQALFCRKLLQVYRVGEIDMAIVMTYALSILNPWFDPFWDFPVCMIRERVQFTGPDGKIREARFCPAVTYLGPNFEEFTKAFSQFGRIAKAIDPPKSRVQPLSLWEGGEP